MRQLCLFAVLFLATSLAAQESSAQAVAIDPTVRLKQVLPADVAERVLARIADARARQLPAEALENRALKFAAKGVAPLDIERSLNEHAQRMGTARNAIARGRAGQPRGDEIEAGAEAIRKGVDAAAVSRLAKAAPSKRSLAVPLYVIGSLADRGFPSDEALDRVLDRIEQSASDAELERMPGQLPAQAGNANAYGKDRAASNPSGSRPPQAAGRPATTGKPAGVPGNGGARVAPGQAKKGPKP